MNFNSKTIVMHANNICHRIFFFEKKNENDTNSITMPRLGDVALDLVNEGESLVLPLPLEREAVALAKNENFKDPCMVAARRIINACHPAVLGVKRPASQTNPHKNNEACCETVAPRHVTTKPCSAIWLNASLHHAALARSRFGSDPTTFVCHHPRWCPFAESTVGNPCFKEACSSLLKNGTLTAECRS